MLDEEYVRKYLEQYLELKKQYKEDVINRKGLKDFWGDMEDYFSKMYGFSLNLNMCKMLKIILELPVCSYCEECIHFEENYDKDINRLDVTCSEGCTDLSDIKKCELKGKVL